MLHKKSLKNQLRFGILLFGLIGCVILSQINNIVGEESVSFGLTDRVGTGLGNKIEGKFTLKAEGSAGIVYMAVYFNDLEVYNISGNKIAWRFSTGDYPIGTTNITVIGWDAQGVPVQDSDIYEFLSPTSTNTVTVIIVVVALIATYLKYRYRARKQTPKQIKDSVEINPDDL